VLSLDLPSGVDPDTGNASELAVCATATLTIALPKLGLLTASGRTHAGALYVVDIGLPRSLYMRLGIEFEDPFASGPVVRLD
jgi:NAD(P)H-hydrate epimerase